MGDNEKDVKNRITVRTLCVLFFALSVSAQAQQPKKIPRIGFLGSLSASASSDQSHAEAFRQGLRELGYVDGKNIVIEYRYADGKFETLPSLAAELVRLKVGHPCCEGAHLRRMLPRMPPVRFRLSWGMPPIPLAPGLSPAWRGLAGT